MNCATLLKVCRGFEPLWGDPSKLATYRNGPDYANTPNFLLLHLNEVNERHYALKFRRGLEPLSVESESTMLPITPTELTLNERQDSNLRTQRERDLTPPHLPLCYSRFTLFKELTGIDPVTSTMLRLRSTI